MPASNKKLINGSPQRCRIECSPHVGASSAVVVSDLFGSVASASATRRSSRG